MEWTPYLDIINLVLLVVIVLLLLRQTNPITGPRMAVALDLSEY